MAAIAYPCSVVTVNPPPERHPENDVGHELAASIADYLGNLSQPKSIRIEDLPGEHWRVYCVMFGYQLHVDIVALTESGADLDSTNVRKRTPLPEGLSISSPTSSDWVINCRIEGNLVRAMMMRLSRQNRNDTLIRFATAVHDSLQGSRLVTRVTWYWGRPQRNATTFQSPREFIPAKNTKQ